MRLHGRLIFLLVAIVLSTSAYADPACTLSPSKISQEIKKDGGAKALQAIYGDYGVEWGALLDCVATGKASWVDIAISLHPYSDGEVAEGLESAMSVALGNNPTYVLDKAIPAFELPTICFSPDPAQTSFDTYDLAMKEWDKQIKAVSGVKRPDLQDKVRACRERLREDEPREANFQG